MTPKYKIGDTFYKFLDGNILKYGVTNINIGLTEIRYTLNNSFYGSFTEENLSKQNSGYYPSAEEAVKYVSEQKKKFLQSEVSSALKHLENKEELLREYNKSLHSHLLEAKKLDKPKKKI